MKGTAKPKVLENLKRSWKVMEFEGLKRVRTLKIVDVDTASFMCTLLWVWRKGWCIGESPEPSHHCGAVSNPGINAICGLSLLLVLSFAPRYFSPGSPVFPSPQKPSFSNSNSTRIGRRRTTLLMEIQSVQTAEKLVHSAVRAKEKTFRLTYSCICYVGQIWFQVNFDSTEVDSQFPSSPSPSSWIIWARKQRK